LLEKTNNNKPLNRFNKKCQVNTNYEREEQKKKGEKSRPSKAFKKI